MGLPTKKWTKQARSYSKLVTALLTEATIPAAASRAGVALSTARRWMACEEFCNQFDEARHEATRVAIGVIQGGMSEAAYALVEISTAGAPDGARVAAARGLIDAGLRTLELETLAELKKRLDALEVSK